MSTIVTRSGKGSALTWTEADSNFTNLNTDKLEAISADLTPQLGGNLDTNGFLISSSTGNVIIDDIAQIDALQIDTTAVITPAVGLLSWDDGNGTLNLGLKGGAVNLAIGQESVVRVYNETGSTLTDGQVVYITGSQGNRLTVGLAVNNSESMSSVTIGVVTETILPGAEGFITTEGVVNGLNTLGLQEGAAIWLSDIAGQYTTLKPSAPNHIVLVGYIVRAHQTTGSIFVHIQNGYELDELHNVSISSPTNTQALIYDSATTLWKNTSLKTINGTSVVGAGNITISSGTGLGSLTAYKRNGAQDDLPVNAVGVVNTLTVGQELILDASAKVAVESTSQYAWRDNIASFYAKGTGTNNPSWITLIGGLAGYGFSATVMNEVWVDFHIDHDYALGTLIYPHVHWMPTTTQTGVVRWGIEYSVAKGHQQGADSTFPATTTVYVEQTIASPSQWQHFVAEVSQANAIPATRVEPDSVIKVRVFRDAANAADTYPGVVHSWQADLHYQFNTLGTLNKAPNFYA